MAIRIISGLLAPIIRRRLSPTTTESLDLQYAVIKSITVEFQEAQCFLMLACQVALLTAVNNPAFFDSHTFASMSNNFQLTSLIAIGGILPISFTTFLLYCEAMLSTYIFILSGVTIAVSIASLTSTPASIDQTYLVGFPNADVLVSCGGNPPPIVYCLSNGDNRENLNAIVLQYCTVIYGGLTILHLWSKRCIRRQFRRIPIERWTPWRKTLFTAKGRDQLATRAHLVYYQDRLRRYTMFRKTEAFYYSLDRSHWLATVNVFKLLLKLTFDGIYIWIFVAYFAAFSDLLWLNGVQLHSWGFGQVVALFIWAPVAVKYMYWTMCESSVQTGRLWSTLANHFRSRHGRAFEGTHRSAVQNHQERRKERGHRVG